MSFMYNPFPYHDPKPVNRPELKKETIDSIVGGGTPAVAKAFAKIVEFFFLKIFGSQAELCAKPKGGRGFFHRGFDPANHSERFFERL